MDNGGWVGESVTVYKYNTSVVRGSSLHFVNPYPRKAPIDENRVLFTIFLRVMEGELRQRVNNRSGERMDEVVTTKVYTYIKVFVLCCFCSSVGFRNITSDLEVFQ